MPERYDCAVTRLDVCHEYKTTRVEIEAYRYAGPSRPHYKAENVPAGAIPEDLRKALIEWLEEM